MTHEEARGVTKIDKANGRGCEARPEYAGDVGDGFEIQLRIRARGRREEVFRHEEISPKCVGDPFGRHFVLWSPFLHPANERLASVMRPMADFMRE